MTLQKVMLVLSAPLWLEASLGSNVVLFCPAKVTEVSRWILAGGSGVCHSPSYLAALSRRAI